MTRLLVTGTGRSGTMWAAEALTEAGAPCGHEHIFGRTDRSTLHRWRAEASWRAAPHLDGLPSDIYVVHLVRHPVHTVASRAKRHTFQDPVPSGGLWAMDVCPEIAEGATALERSAIHWAAWNRLVEPHAHERLRLEDVTAADVERLARLVNPDARLDRLPPPVHVSVPAVRVSWDDLAHITGLVDLAASYGYTPDDGARSW